MVRAIAVCLLGLGMAACQGNGKATDGGEEILPLDERLQPGEVRAGVITKESELLEGPEAHGWLGDYKIYNDRVAFVIQNIDSPRGWGPYGGSLLDADRVREQGEPGHELFQETFPVINLLSVRPTFAEVASEGRDGQAAVIRIRGEHQGIPLVDAATGGAMQPEDLDITHEYILEPDTDYLVIRTSLRMRGPSPLNVSAGDMLLNGDYTTDFAPDDGLLPDFPPIRDYPYITGFSPEVCYLYTGLRADVRVAIRIEAVAPFVVTDGMVPSALSQEEDFVIERILAVGDGDQDACLRIYHDLREQTATGLLSGTVAGEAGAMILAKKVSEPWVFVNQTYTTADGTFEMELLEGQYLVVVQAAGREELVSDPVDVLADQTSQVSLQLPEPAILSYNCELLDSAGDPSGPLPCKISLQAGPGAAMSSAVQAESMTFGITGTGEIVVTPGDWTVTLSRGWEYSIHRQDVVTRSGETTEIHGTLQRQVDTQGLIAADLHTHCTRSIDSGYRIKDKIGSNICEGVELVVITDHDCQTDFTPFIDELKQELSFDLDQLTRAVTGNEISPLYGHMTVFPLPTHPTGWIYWQIPWTLYQDGNYLRMLEFPELWELARELGARVINVAHPLSGSGYFNYLGFDPPQSLPPVDDLPPEKYSDQFDTMELLNGHNVSGMLAGNLPLWSHLNNQGVFRTAVGVSDSHARSSEAGFGRTLVVSSSDEPKEIDLEEIWTNLQQGHALVGGGILVTLQIEDARPGDLVSIQPPAEALVHVEAADWVAAETVALLANGEYLVTLDLEPAGQLDPDHPAVRFHGPVAIEPTVDTWYAALASGGTGATLDPVFHGCRPVGMTNAIRVDVDGNGSFDPPGL